jgi:hypothetical protein
MDPPNNQQLPRGIFSPQNKHFHSSWFFFSNILPFYPPLSTPPKPEMPSPFLSLFSPFPVFDGKSVCAFIVLGVEVRSKKQPCVKWTVLVHQLPPFPVSFFPSQSQLRNGKRGRSSL